MVHPAAQVVVRMPAIVPDPAQADHRVHARATVQAGLRPGVPLAGVPAQAAGVAELHHQGLLPEAVVDHQAEVRQVEVLAGETKH